MVKLRLSFYECEHEGDLATYVADVVACGGKVLKQTLKEDSEQGIVIVEVADKASFLSALIKTPSGDFVWPPLEDPLWSREG
jgi:hypothetical protein